MKRYRAKPIFPYVDRTYENDTDPEICVVFRDETIRFWLTGLSDTEYIKRARQIRKLEKVEKLTSN